MRSDRALLSLGMGRSRKRSSRGYWTAMMKLMVSTSFTTQKVFTHRVGPPQQRPRVDNISPQASTSGLKLKLSSQPAYNPTPTHSSVDFTLPNPPLRQLIPPRPTSHKPPKPGPKRQADVDEDYSNVKVSGQVNFQTFWQGVEPYLREVREDDLAMLGFTVSSIQDVPRTLN